MVKALKRFETLGKKKCLLETVLERALHEKWPECMRDHFFKMLGVLMHQGWKENAIMAGDEVCLKRLVF